jgi:hypothetical protein
MAVPRAQAIVSHAEAMVPHVMCIDLDVEMIVRSVEAIGRTYEATLPLVRSERTACGVDRPGRGNHLSARRADRPSRSRSTTEPRGNCPVRAAQIGFVGEPTFRVRRRSFATRKRAADLKSSPYCPLHLAVFNGEVTVPLR